MSESFIQTYPNVISDEFCDDLIKSIEFVIESNPSEIQQGDTQYPEGALKRKDEAIFLEYKDIHLFSDLNEHLNTALEDYTTKFPILRGMQFRSTTAKIQKTEVGGGYMDWHGEVSRRDVSDRLLVWAIYLNDLPDGEGETEFLYQHKRFKPEKGMGLIFPADFTHCHRGNPPLTTTKYITTGWYVLY